MNALKLEPVMIEISISFSFSVYLIFTSFFSEQPTKNWYPCNWHRLPISFFFIQVLVIFFAFDFVFSCSTKFSSSENFSGSVLLFCNKTGCLKTYCVGLYESLFILSCTSLQTIAYKFSYFCLSSKLNFKNKSKFELYALYDLVFFSNKSNWQKTSVLNFLFLHSFTVTLT